MLWHAASCCCPVEVVLAQQAVMPPCILNYHPECRDCMRQPCAASLCSMTVGSCLQSEHASYLFGFFRQLASGKVESALNIKIKALSHVKYLSG